MPQCQCMFKAITVNVFDRFYLSLEPGYWPVKKTKIKTEQCIVTTSPSTFFYSTLNVKYIYKQMFSFSCNSYFHLLFKWIVYIIIKWVKVLTHTRWSQTDLEQYQWYFYLSVLWNSSCSVQSLLTQTHPIIFLVRFFPSLSVLCLFP